ncbi:MAG: FAD-dependent oxidoreductase, partial [Rhodoferax sp.]
MPELPTLNTRCCIAGGGPAGMMLGLLLARAGVDVLVLEKHADFLRDFRGDTVHPSTMEVMHELGLLSRFLQRPHDEVRKLHAMVGDTDMVLADFSRLRTHCRFIALMPQWEFLDFLRDEAERYPNFRLLRRADVTGVIEQSGRVTGVQVQTPEGLVHVQADLVIGADGRHSTVRTAADLAVRDVGAPIDVLWLRLPRLPGDPSVTGGRINTGSFLVMLDRGSYWQCAYVIAKGGIEAVQARGLEAFHAALVRVAPLLADRVHLLANWDDIKLLSVTVDRLERWWRPSLLCIGDAAHAMSPVGGVGINLAIQDAVATANVLAAPLADRHLGAGALTSLLASIEKRRLFPTRVTQAMQVAVQNRVLSAVVDPARTAPMTLPWPLRLFKWFPMLRRLPAWLVGLGVRPEHVHIIEPMNTSPSNASADARPPRPRPTPRRIEVLKIQPLSAYMTRISFGGAEMAGFEWRGPAGHLKLTVPDEGEREAPMPQDDGPRSVLMRTYTPRSFDATAQTLDVDFVLHAHGPAGRWASR